MSAKNRKLSSLQVEEIRRRRARGELLSDLAREFGVDASTLSRVVRGERHRDCAGPLAPRQTKKADDEWYRVDEQTGCWIWIGRLNPRGYGVHATGYDAGYSQLAHRYMYEVRVGPIEPGMEIDHLCSNTSCVNLEHLEQVTGVENVQRWRMKGAGMSWDKIREIRRLYLTGCWGQHRLAEKFSIGRGAVQRIVKNETWTDSKYVPDLILTRSAPKEVKATIQKQLAVQIPKLLKEKRDLSSRQLVDLTQEAPWNIRVILDDLQASGQIEKRGKRRWTRYHWVDA